MKILKIGGSVLTHKDELHPTLHLENLHRIASEIKQWLLDKPDNRLILVTGAGSFGHPLAKKYQINLPGTGKDNLGFVKITTSMQNMANLVANAFHDIGVPVFPTVPSSIFETDEGRIVIGNLTPVEQAIKRGLVPFLWGDAVFDRSHQFRILSGDQINTFLAVSLDVAEIVFGTNVSGVYSDDPHLNPEAALIEEITDENYSDLNYSLSSSSHVDVTGGMRGKIEEIYRTQKRPLKGIIYDATQSENTYRALSGSGIGTRISFEATS